VVVQILCLLKLGFVLCNAFAAGYSIQLVVGGVVVDMILLRVYCSPAVGFSYYLLAMCLVLETVNLHAIPAGIAMFLLRGLCLDLLVEESSFITPVVTQERML
jgi:hypothetical protein